MPNAWTIGIKANEVAEQKGVTAGFNYVRREMRAIDESDLFPICGDFNATERAIRRLRASMNDGLYIESPLEYALELDAVITDIVNSGF